jgi:ribosome-binding ATPase YchF (GTP1/OBG family)
MINHLQNANVLCPVFGAYQETGSTEDVAEMMRALIEDFETELLLSDLQVAESRAEKIASSKQRGIKVDAAEDRAITKVLDALNEETPLRLIELGMEEEKAIRSYAFLTLKPLLIVINKGEEQDSNALQQALSDFEGDQKKLIVLDAQMEAEIAGLPEEDRGEFLEEMGIESPASERLLQESFNLLGLIRFFTVGEDEVRSWPIRKGTPAVEAAGEIHSDLQRGFIRAEVVHSTDLLELGSMSACRDKGVLRLEGKTYEVRDGDVMHVRFAV